MTNDVTWHKYANPLLWAILILCLASSASCSKTRYLPADYRIERLNVGQRAPYAGVLLTVSAFERLYRRARMGPEDE